MLISLKRYRARLLGPLLSTAVIGTFLVVTSSAASAQTSYTLGIDISHHQPAPDWDQVAQSGHYFVFHKATEGATFTDPEYAQNRSGAASVGLAFGAYHFARPEGDTSESVQADARAEAQHFLAVAQPAPGDLLPVLDLEANGGLTSQLLIEWTQTWVDTVRAAVGSRVIIYTGPNFWRTSMGDTDTFALQGLPLWLAHYTSASSPSVPAANWANNGWSFWQWTNCATIPGISGCVDEDRLYGSDLSPFSIPGAPEPEPTQTGGSPPVNQTPPVISGETKVGETVQATTGAWEGSQPQSYSFAWDRCGDAGGGCSPTGGTGPRYSLTEADAGYRMKVSVTATNSAGSAAADSAQSSVVAGAAPPDPPRITDPSARFTLGTTIGVAWTHPDPEVRFDVRYRLSRPDGPTTGPTSITTATTDGSATIRSRTGSTYCFSARALDPAGSASVWSNSRCTTVPLDDRDLTRGSGWRNRSGGRYFLETVRRSSAKGSVLRTQRVHFKEIRLLAERCRDCGRVAVLFKGSRLATIDLRAKRAGVRVISIARFSSSRRGKVSLVVTSRGRPVRIDGVILR